MLNKTCLVLFMLSLAGCAALPKELQVSDESQLVDYSQVTSAPEQNNNKLVRWGGMIAEVHNLDNTSVVEMVYYPLRDYGKPLMKDNSVGFFRVYLDEVLDSEVYSKGRLVTFTGLVKGIEYVRVEGQRYALPAVLSNTYYLWKDEFSEGNNDIEDKYKHPTRSSDKNWIRATDTKR